MANVDLYSIDLNNAVLMTTMSSVATPDATDLLNMEMKATASKNRLANRETMLLRTKALCNWKNLQYGNAEDSYDTRCAGAAQQKQKETGAKPWFS